MSDALAAILLGQQQNQRRYDPADRSRAFAARLMQEGSSTAPVQSPLERLARALQGGVGGFFAGQADREATEKQRRTTGGLLDYAGITGPQRDQLLDLDPSMAGAIAITLLGQKQALASSTSTYNAKPPIGGGSPMPGGGISTAPLPPMNAAAAGQSVDAQNAVKFFTGDPDLKLEPHQAAGLVGNLYRESNLNPMAVNPGDGRDGSNSIGISQWNAGRAQALKQFAASNNLDPTSLNTQLAFTKSELLGSENPQLAALRQAGTVNDAARIGVNFFRPADTQGAIDKSSTYANAIYGAPTPEQMAANPTGPATASGAPVDPNAPAPSFVQTGSPQAPGAPPVTVQATPPAVAPTTLPAVSPEALALQDQARAAAASGTPQGMAEANRLMDEAHKAQQAHAVKRQETIDQRTYAQQTEAQKNARTQADEAAKNARELAEKQAQIKAPQPKEYEDVRTLRGEVATLVGSLQDYQDESKKAGFWDKAKSVTGATTALNTKFNNAALLAKGKALYELGVLSKDDLSIIQRTLPDPSTLSGSAASAESVKLATDSVIDLLQSKLAAREKQIGLPISDARKLAADARPPAFPAAAMDRLKANPGEAALFDEQFGPGSAAKVLGK